MDPEGGRDELFNGVILEAEMDKRQRRRLGLAPLGGVLFCLAAVGCGDGASGSAAVLGAVPAPSEDGARLVFGESAHDFGKVSEGKVVTHLFPFTAQGSESLVISRVDSSCGCTAKNVFVERMGVRTAYVFGEEIPPGTRCWVEARMDTSDITHTKSATVTATSNDPTGPKTVRVKVTVLRPFYVEPSYLNFQVIARGTTPTAKALVRSDFPDRSFEVVDVIKGHPGLVVETSPMAGQAGPGNGIEVSVTLPPDLPLGTFNAKARLVMGDGKSVDVNLFALVQGPVRLMPQDQLPFGLLRRGLVSNRHVDVVGNDTGRVVKATAVEVRSAFADHVMVHLRSVEGPDAHLGRTRVEVAVQPTMPVGVFSGTLLVSTDHPDMVLIEVPFSGVVR